MNFNRKDENWTNNLPKKIQRKAVKFKLKIIAWLIALLLLAAMMFSGCITKKGHKLGGGFIKGDDGVYRRPPSSQTIVPAPSPPVKSNPVPIKPAYDPPNTDKIKESAAPTPNPVIVKAQPEKLPPIKVEPRKEINLGLIKIKLPNNDPEESTDSTGDGTPNVVVDRTDDAIAPLEKEGVKVHWAELFIFYLNAVLVLCFIYFVYKLIKGEILWKEPEINKHLKKLKIKKNVKRRATKETKKVSK